VGKNHYLGWPNRITIGRILLTGPFVVCLLNVNSPGKAWLRWVAIGIFAIMALSDMLDGYLARRMRDESPLGKFLDPLADKLLITAAVIILCVLGVRDASDPSGTKLLSLPNWVVVAAIGKDILVLIGFVAIIIFTGRVHIEPRRLGKWCTTLELLLVLSMLSWMDLPLWLKDLPRVLWWAAAVLAILAAIDYIRAGSRFLASNAPTPGGSGERHDESR
jgi:CDP-diacylglycerol--glycerol-3-phosphate 3-phosphatidyltransferase